MNGHLAKILSISANPNASRRPSLKGSTFSSPDGADDLELDSQFLYMYHYLNNFVNDFNATLLLRSATCALVGTAIRLNRVTY